MSNDIKSMFEKIKSETAEKKRSLEVKPNFHSWPMLEGSFATKKPGDEFPCIWVTTLEPKVGQHVKATTKTGMIYFLVIIRVRKKLTSRGMALVECQWLEKK